MIIRLEKPIRSLNQLMRWHWAARMREKQAWIKDVWAAFNGRPPIAKGKVKIRIVSHRKRILDRDNLYGGSKLLIDALKELKICIDDSPKFAEITCEQVKISHAGKTEIFIEEVA